VPVGHCLINLYGSPVEGFIRNFFLINPFQRRLSGKVSDYRDLGGKKFRLNGCSALPPDTNERRR
jgi:hypothetical protein